MATNVTVLGASGTTVTIPFTTASNAAAAQSALNTINAGVTAGTFQMVNYTGGGTIPALSNATIQGGVVTQGVTSVPLQPFFLNGNYTAAVSQSTLATSVAAQQGVIVGFSSGDTVVTGTGGGVVDNFGTNTQVFFAGQGTQSFAQINVPGVSESAEIWLDGTGTFEDSSGSTKVHIDTVAAPTSVLAFAGSLALTNNGTGTTTVNLATATAAATVGGYEDEVISFSGSSAIPTTVNAGAGSIAGAPVVAFIATASGIINGNASEVILFGGGSGAATLFGGTNNDIDAGANGIAIAGSKGGSFLFGSATAGASTIVGGGANDVLASVGNKTLMIAGLGNESLFAFGTSTIEGLGVTTTLAGATLPSAQTSGAITNFQGEVNGNTYITGAGQTSIQSFGAGGNVYQEGVVGTASVTATISGAVASADSISLSDPAGGKYTLITSGTPTATQVLLTTGGGNSIVQFGDNTTWTFLNATLTSSNFH